MRLELSASKSRRALYRTLTPWSFPNLEGRAHTCELPEMRAVPLASALCTLFAGSQVQGGVQTTQDKMTSLVQAETRRVLAEVTESARAHSYYSS